MYSGPGSGDGTAPPANLPPGLDTPSPTNATESRSSPLGGQLSQEITTTIGSQVRHMIAQAKGDSEVKVKRELGKLKLWMQQMDEKLDAMLAHVEGVEPPKFEVEPTQVTGLLQKIEAQWGKELGTLKQELHQTILAHNHNADLMKAHKDALDAIRVQLDNSAPLRAEQINTQLAKVDSVLQSQQTKRKLDPLFSRLQILEQRVVASYTGQMPPSQPTQPRFPIVPPGTAAGQPSPTAPALATPGKGSSKGGTSAVRVPTDEEVAARLQTLSKAAAPAPATDGLRSEAPVFVPSVELQATTVSETTRPPEVEAPPS